MAYFDRRRGLGQTAQPNSTGYQEKTVFSTDGVPEPPPLSDLPGYGFTPNNNAVPDNGFAGTGNNYGQPNSGYGAGTGNNYGQPNSGYGAGTGNNYGQPNSGYGAGTGNNYGQPNNGYVPSNNNYAAPNAPASGVPEYGGYQAAQARPQNELPRVFASKEHSGVYIYEYSDRLEYYLKTATTMYLFDVKRKV